MQEKKSETPHEGYVRVDMLRVLTHELVTSVIVGLTDTQVPREKRDYYRAMVGLSTKAMVDKFVDDLLVLGEIDGAPTWVPGPGAEPEPGPELRIQALSTFYSARQAELFEVPGRGTVLVLSPETLRQGTRVPCRGEQVGYMGESYVVTAVASELSSFGQRTTQRVALNIKKL